MDIKFNIEVVTTSEDAAYAFLDASLAAHRIIPETLTYTSVTQRVMGQFAGVVYCGSFTVEV